MANSNLRQKRHLYNKQAILEAARQIIAEKGLAGLSVRDLAQAIGYSHAALYEYFSSKDAIIDTLCQESWGRLANHLGSVTPDLPPSGQLLEMAKAYLDFTQKYPNDYLLMFATRQEQPQTFEDIAANATFAALLKTV